MLNIITNGYVLPFLSKPNLVRFPLILSEYKARQIDQTRATCIQSLLSKNAIESVENVKSLGFYSRLFLVPKPHQRWRPVIDLSRLNTFLHVEKFKMETRESIGTSLIPGEWVSSKDLSDAYLHIPILPNSRKYLRFCYKSQVFQFTSLPFRLATAPQVFTMVVKEVKLMALSRGLRLHQYLDDWLIRSQSQEEAQVNTQAVVDLTQSLGWIINQEKSELKPTQVFSFVGYEYHLDSALVKPTQERWLKLQDLILRLKSKRVLTARCLMSLIGLLASTEKMVPEGRLHMRPFQFHLKEHWMISSVTGQSSSLDRNHFSTLRLVAKSLKRDERFRPSSQRPQYPTLYRRLKRRLGRSLRSKFYKGSVVRPGKKATHKCSRVEGGLSGPSKLQGPVPEPNSATCNGQLNSGSLHKQTRRNSLSRDVRSPVEDHDMVSSLSHNIKSQTHSRVSECDGRPPVQVKPSAVNRMVTASAGVQTDLPKVVYSSCRSICHSSEPQTSTGHVSSPLRYYLDRTKDLRVSRSLLLLSFKKGHTSDIRPATLSSWLKQTILLCYKQADQQALNLVQVKAHDIRAFMASKAFYGGVSVDQIMQACHWKAHNTFTNFYLKDLTWSDNDNNMYLGPVVVAQQVLDPSPQTSYPRKEKKGGAQPLQPSLHESNPRIQV